MSNESDKELYIAFEHGAESRESEIESLRQQLVLAQAKIDMLNSPVVLSDWQKLERQLADSQKQVTMLRDKVDWLRRYGCKDDLAFRVAQDALAATEPKP